MVRIPTHRTPTHPGEMLLEEFLTPMGISQRELADAIHVPYQRINELVNGRPGVTPSTAVRLARFFGMTPSQPRARLLSVRNYESGLPKHAAFRRATPRANDMPLRFVFALRGVAGTTG